MNTLTPMVTASGHTGTVTFDGVSLTITREDAIVVSLEQAPAMLEVRAAVEAAIAARDEATAPRGPGLPS